MNAGKGDKPRNCFTKQFKSNYEEIDWGKSSKPKKKKNNLIKDCN